MPRRYYYEVGSMRTPTAARPPQCFEWLDSGLDWCRDDPQEKPNHQPAERPWVARIDRQTGEHVMLVVAGRAQTLPDARGRKGTQDELKLVVAWEAERRQLCVSNHTEELEPA